MNCKVKISGAGQPVASSGSLVFTDAGFCVEYTLDGDKCNLSVADGKIFLSRKGGFNFEITFEEGKETECVLRRGGLSGAVPVKTLSFKIFKTPESAFIRMKYLFGGEERELILSAEAL